MSLIRLIDSLCSNVISSHIFSIVVLNASVNRTKKSALIINSHSHWVSEKNTPRIKTLKAEIMWYWKWRSLRTRNPIPLNAKCNFCKNVLMQSNLPSFRWIARYFDVILHTVHCYILMKKGGGIGPVKPWQPPIYGIGAKSNQHSAEKISNVSPQRFFHLFNRFLC